MNGCWRMRVALIVEELSVILLFPQEKIIPHHFISNWGSWNSQWWMFSIVFVKLNWTEKIKGDIFYYTQIRWLSKDFTKFRHLRLKLTKTRTDTKNSTTFVVTINWRLDLKFSAPKCMLACVICYYVHMQIRLRWCGLMRVQTSTKQS